MKLVPVLLGKKTLKIALRLFDARTAGQPPTLRQAMDMSIDRKGRHAKRLGHYDTGGLVADARQTFELFEAARHFAPKPADKLLRKADDRLGLLGSQPTATDEILDFGRGEPGHRLRRRGQGEEFRGYLIDPAVGALGREENRDQQGIGVAMIEGYGRFGIKLRQPALNVSGSLGPASIRLHAG